MFAALLMALAAPSLAGVTVAITPSSQTVALGSEFDVSITITEAGSQFNAFGLVIGFDPEVLTPVTITPLSAQVGGAMTEACSNNFNHFRAGTATDTINCSMLCAGVSITGPGEIYRLRFRAAANAESTPITFLEHKFYRGGVLVTPVNSEPAVVQVVPQLAVGDPSAKGFALVSVSPNPSPGGTWIEYTVPHAAFIRLGVFDVQGREVARLAEGIHQPGRHRVIWEARRVGRAVHGGLYFVRYQTPAGQVMRRLAITR